MNATENKPGQSVIEIETLGEGDYWRDWQGYEERCEVNDPNASFPRHYRRALIDGAHVGWIRYQLTASTTYVFDVYVAPGYRGRGVASALMRAAIGDRVDVIVDGCWMEHRLSEFARKHNNEIFSKKRAGCA